MTLFYPFDTNQLRLGGEWGDEDFWPLSVFGGGQQRGRAARPSQQRQTTTLIRPEMDWLEQEDKNIVTLELAGLTKKDVELSLHENLLTVSGSLSTEKETKEDASHLICERRYGAFSRAFTVPAGLKQEEIKASMEHGVLKIEFPKEAKESETKKITIA